MGSLFRRNMSCKKLDTAYLGLWKRITTHMWKLSDRPAVPGNESNRSAESTLKKKAFEAHVQQAKYAGDPMTSLWVAVRTLIGYCAVWAIVAYGSQPATLFPGWARVSLGLLWSLIHVRCFVIFHDCGHKSFVQGFETAPFWNTVALYTFSFCCACTPTDWNTAHAVHHRHVGNIDQVDAEWCETVFHTKAKYLSCSIPKQYFHSFLRHPVVFFLMAPLLTWWLKFRAPIEAGPYPKRHYRLTDKAVALSMLIATYYVAYHGRYLDILFMAEYVGAIVGVMLFHAQHVFDEGYIRNENDWNYHDASVHGSSLLVVPECLKWVTLGIEYHHIHHARTRVPGYMLRVCHEEAPQKIWEHVVVVDYYDLWRSLAMQCWDDDRKTFSTFAQVCRDESTKRSCKAA